MGVPPTPSGCHHGPMSGVLSRTYANELALARSPATANVTLIVFSSKKVTCPTLTPAHYSPKTRVGLDRFPSSDKCTGGPASRWLPLTLKLAHLQGAKPSVASPPNSDRRPRARSQRKEGRPQGSPQSYLSL